QFFESARQRCVVFVAQVDEPAAMCDRREVDLVRPERKLGHKRDPALIAEDPAYAVLLGFDDVAVQAAPRLALVPRLGRELALQDRRHEWVGIDLSMRMAEGDTDLFA